MAAEPCPRRRDTVTGSTPSASSVDAWVWRKLWKLALMPSRLVARSHALLIERGDMIPPSTVANIGVSGASLPLPRANHCSCCARRCARNTSTVAGANATAVPRLGRLDRNALPGLLDRALDPHGAGVEIEIAPTQP